MLSEAVNPRTFFPHLDEFAHRTTIDSAGNPWEAVASIAGHIREIMARLRGSVNTSPLKGAALANRTLRFNETMIIVERVIEVREGMIVEGTEVFLAEGVVLEPGALIKSPAIIGAETEVRHGAYLRGDVLVGRLCTVGHATEVKNSIFMNHSEAGHFAYVGDSILGSYVNIGAGAKLANLQLRRSADKLRGTFPPIALRIGPEKVKTGMSKFGAVLGDHAEVGCNAVTAPGVLCGAHSWIFANATVAKGFYPPRTIIR